MSRRVLSAQPYDLDMPRDGRALELLVARLEAVAADTDTRISSPEFIRGKLSNSMREVDVTVRSKVGTSEVLVMFECRDRAGTEDVRWIEEISGKKEDVRANVAVAVARRGKFSSGARSMAEALGIQLRTVEQITVTDVAGWCSMTHLKVHVIRTRNQDMRLAYFADTPAMTDATGQDEEGNPQLPIDVPVFTLWDANNRPPPEDPEFLTGQELHRRTVDLALGRRGEVDLSEWTPIEVVVSKQEMPLVAVRTAEGLYPLAEVVAIAEARIDETEVPLTVHSVTQEDGSITQVVEGVAEWDGRERTVTFVKTEDDQLTVLVQAHDDELGDLDLGVALGATPDED